MGMGFNLLSSQATADNGAAQAGGSEWQDLPRNLRVVLENTKPLVHSRGNRLPLYVLPITSSLRGVGDTRAEAILRRLDERGIAMTVDWSYGDKDKSLAEGLRVAALQKRLGLAVNVNATGCLHSFFNGDESTAHVDSAGKPFFDDSFAPGVKMGCPFALDARYPVVKEQVEFFLRGYQEQQLPIDFAFADWEIDGPIEWNGAWACSKRCRRCREHIPKLDDFRTFQKELRLIRSDMQRVAFAENVTRYFPGAKVGNYGVYPDDGYRYWYDYFEQAVSGAPVKADQQARYREWFPEFDRTKYTCAMPVVYTWYPIFQWYDFPDTDYRWFYNMLLTASTIAPHNSTKVPVITFVHWTTTAPPPSPDPSVRQMSAVRYQDLLRHLLLRGHDAFFLWCQENELAEEIRLVHEVYAEALEYKTFLEQGRPISFDVPSMPGTVISGLRSGDKVLVRRTDFMNNKRAVVLSIETRNLKVEAQDRWQVLTLNGK